VFGRPHNAQQSTPRPRTSVEAIFSPNWRIASIGSQGAYSRLFSRARFQFRPYRVPRRWDMTMPFVCAIWGALGRCYRSCKSLYTFMSQSLAKMLSWAPPILGAFSSIIDDVARDPRCSHARAQQRSHRTAFPDDTQEAPTVRGDRKARQNDRTIRIHAQAHHSKHTVL
jgi:hypothetical protein